MSEGQRTFNPPWEAVGGTVAFDALDKFDLVPRRFAERMAKRRVGQTVLKTGGVYITTSSPTTEELDAADIVYLGGHVYEVDQAEAAALIEAGFEANLS